MADYGNYNTGTGDVISAIQRPALDVEEERQKALGNIRAANQQAAANAQFAPYQEANDLINQAIAARQNIEQRRFDLSRQLEGVTNRRQAASIASQIEGLDRMSASRAWEADQRRMMAHNMSEAMAERLKVDRSASIDEESSALMTGLGKLDALRRNGGIDDSRYDSALLDLGQQYGLGLKHPVAGRMFTHYVEEADRRNQFNLRRTASEAAKIAGKYGTDVQLGEDGLPSIEATRKAALQTPRGRHEFLKGMDDEMMRKYGVPTGVSSLFNPVKPHEDTNDKKSIKVPFVNQGKVGEMDVPKPLFEQMKSDFQDRYFSVIPPANEPTGNVTPAQQQVAGGVEIGTRRTIGGIDAVWDGRGWKKAQ